MAWLFCFSILLLLAAINPCGKDSRCLTRISLGAFHFISRKHWNYCLPQVRKLIPLFADVSIDLPQVDLINFRVEYVRPRSGRCLGRKAAERATKSREVRRVLNKQDEGLFRKSNVSVSTFVEFSF